MKHIRKFNEKFLENADLHPITNSIIEQIEWARNNNSKSEWDDYGASGCMADDDITHSINRIKELPTDEIILILKQLIDNYKKKYSLDVVGMILMSIDDLDDFKKILDSDDRFEY
jgi:hypothetical protein